METAKPRNLSTSKKKFRSPVVGKRAKTTITPRFKLNIREPEKSPKFKKGGKLHFRLGGDSTDPLNLNSLINRDPSEVTPQCSPYTDRESKMSPCVVVQPQDCKDPLNLKCDVIVVTPTRRKRKRKRNDSGCYEREKDVAKNENVVKERKRKKDGKKTTKDGKLNAKSKRKIGKENKHRKDSSEKEELEVEPLEPVKDSAKDVHEPDYIEPKPIPNEDTKPVHDNTLSIQETSVELKAELLPEEEPKQEKPITKKIQPTKNLPKKSKQKKTFFYGNYNRYYGYRNSRLPDDPRLKLFQADWFAGKDVLDIGCNIGNVTMQVAREFLPQRVLGIDIDGALVRSANKNLKAIIQEHVIMENKDFPISFLVCRGPIMSLGSSSGEKKGFPYNVVFKEENFVPQNDKAVARQKPTYDVILCLSLTKWIHLNWGDEGIKRTFKKMFMMLRPGGHLLLEAQPFDSYSRRKNLSEKIRHHYDNIQFKPNQFVDFLMSEEVGFASYEALGISENSSKGFQRPLYLFTKSFSRKCYDALGENISETRDSASSTPSASHSYFD